MTKYEEMPLGSQILPGDRVTKVFEVMQGLRISSADCGTITKIERPIPEVVLPTVPGYYERVRFPISRGYFAIRLDEHGKWHREGMRVTKEQLRVSYLPLTRLVPESAPAKLADRLDVDRLTDKIIALVENKRTSWGDNATDLIDAIDNGELDK